ncbi:Endoglucanase-5 [Arthrobotrys entomopaga]|nr:Endoglucanase-5 [Arthrobotrys entomopaga]
MKSKSVVAAALIGAVSAQQTLYGQCGGVGWTGPTSCGSGASCNYLNDYYSQCLPGGGNGNPTTTKATTTAARTTTPMRTTTRTTTANGSTNTGTGTTPISGGSSGSGQTTRYWDCCKPSCAWSGKGPNIPFVCDANGNHVSNAINAVSSCDGGSAYMCNNQTPWAVNDNVAYGFAAVSIAGSTEQHWCCSCYELTFTSGPVAGKKLVVQATNTGGDLGSNQFDLAIPGGGFGIFNGCAKEFPSTPSGNWGAQYGGVSSASQCSGLPSALQAGCNFRFGWMMGADNPSVSFVEVQCPSAITSVSGCTR